MRVKHVRFGDVGTVSGFETYRMAFDSVLVEVNWDTKDEHTPPSTTLVEDLKLLPDIWS